VKPVDYVRAVKLALAQLGIEPDELGGLITNENGGTATVNGWFQSAVLDIPVVDAPCNGRAHPTGLMGAMGLEEREGYTTVQAAAGGSRADGRYLELTVSGKLGPCAGLVRQASVRAGGFVAVARNPVKASWAASSGAPGAVRQAIELGHAVLDATDHGGHAVAGTAAGFLDGEVAAVGSVQEVELATRGGFDVGRVSIGTKSGAPIELTFWNEFMTCERAGRRLAAFPDLIALVDTEESRAVTTAELQEGMQTAVLVAPRDSLRLGAGMRSAELMKAAERAVGKSLTGKAHKSQE
jgi:hypothetical protein